MSVHIPIYILAGGRSLRFGSDKARADIRGVPMLTRLAKSLRPAAESMTVVAERAEKYADLALPTIGDESPGQGPLGGLITALSHRRSGAGPGWLLLTSCDWAEIRIGWLDLLWSHAEGDVDAVSFRDDRWQPLFALYHTRAHTKSANHLARCCRRISHFLDEAAARAVPVPSDWSMTWQINTRAQRDHYLHGRSDDSFG